MSAHPKTMLPAFDRGQRIRTVFKLLASSKEILVEKRNAEITSDWKIENPSMIKVIAILLQNSPDNIHLYDIKSRFLDDVILLSSASRENRCESTKPIADFINHSNHQIFCANVVHIISPMSEVLCNVCGGLLPLLASAISASHEIEILENTEDLSPFNAIKILEHVISLADLFILANSSNFFELKQ
ncbi:unnamed protein product [Rotaria sp. Silwood1]|nr:unnamed protein product [Rotaria sp. Silwood1]